MSGDQNNKKTRHEESQNNKKTGDEDSDSLELIPT